MRQAIADEVQRQLDAEKNAAANSGNPQQAGGPATDSAPPALSADARVFVVSAPLQVTDGDQPCSLTAGDIVSRVEDSPGSDGAVAVSVLNSKPSDCRSGAQPRVQVTDLQDMANDLRAQTDEGLKNLSQKQGTNGMPPAPDATAVPNPNGQGTPDPDAANQVKQQQQDADQTEKEVGTGQGGPGGPGGNEVRLLPESIFPNTLPIRASRRISNAPARYRHKTGCISRRAAPDSRLNAERHAICGIVSRHSNAYLQARRPSRLLRANFLIN